MYYKINKEYLICDPDDCAQSERSIDMPFFDLANNEKLLNKLGLYYIQGNYGVKYTYDSRGKWFSGYLSAFGNKGGQYEKLITNPIVRILILEEALFLYIAGTN